MVAIFLPPASGSERDFFAIVSRQIVFQPSTQSMQTIVTQVRIVDDIFVENDEFLRAIMALSTIDPAVQLNPGEASIIIIDDDGTSYCSTVLLSECGICRYTVKTSSDYFLGSLKCRLCFCISYVLIMESPLRKVP